MKILVVSCQFPRADQSAGDLRFLTLLSILASRHEVVFHVMEHLSYDENSPAKIALTEVGVHVTRDAFASVLRQASYDVVLFEFYYAARGLIDVVRTWQPSARIVVDSVDVNFHRLRSKARLTRLASDEAAAEKVRAAELATYQEADLVLAVSKDDQRILLEEGLLTAVDIVPTIHEMHPLRPHQWSDCLELIFIGSYKHTPNVDAMLYFCSDIMPILRQQIPRLRLRIIGSSPSNEIIGLAAADIEVIGFVQSTTDYLLSSDISIAPLRFGAGMKGKIGEAIAHGLPVVTTAVGAEGFGFRTGHDIMTANSPSEFASAIVSLWSNMDLYEKIRANGWARIKEMCSIETVERLIPQVLHRIQSIPNKRISRFRQAKVLMPYYYDRYVSWRLRR